MLYGYGLSFHDQKRGVERLKPFTGNMWTRVHDMVKKNTIIDMYLDFKNNAKNNLLFFLKIVEKFKEIFRKFFNKFCVIFYVYFNNKFVCDCIENRFKPINNESYRFGIASGDINKIHFLKYQKLKNWKVSKQDLKSDITKSGPISL